MANVSRIPAYRLFQSPCPEKIGSQSHDIQVNIPVKQVYLCHGQPIRAPFRITYLCSRSCERSEQFARVPTRRARFLYSKVRARPGERINGAQRNVSREERVAEHRRRPARRGAEWLHGVMRSKRTKIYASASRSFSTCSMAARSLFNAESLYIDLLERISLSDPYKASS